MGSPLVYLAGPIKGCTEEQAVGWRTDMEGYFAVNGVRTFSPLRAKEELWEATELVGYADSYAHLGPFFTTRGIMQRDFSDVNRADLLLVNLLDQPEGMPSIGTAMELAWAYQLRTPVVVAIAPDNPAFQHPLLREAIDGLHFDNLYDAAHAAVVVLNE